MDIAKAHALCAALPAATLDHKWRFEDSVHPVFSVGDRMFAMFTMKRERLVDRLLFKVDDDRFLELTDRDGFAPAPYLARARWVALDGIARVPDVELAALLVDAHCAIVRRLSKKEQRELLGDAGAVHQTKATA